MEIHLKQGVATTIVFPLLTAASSTRKSAATVAAGDFKILRHTAGSWDSANATTSTPTEISTSGMYALPLTATELTPDDQQYPIMLACHDAAGAEWDDQSVIIRVFDNDIETPGNAAGVTSILADYARRTGDYATVAALSTLQGNVTTILGDYARRTGDYSTLTEALVRTALGMAAADLDTQLDALAAGFGGIGAILTTFTVKDAVNQPLDGALVEISTDALKVNVIATGYTLTNGIVKLNLDPGTYYLWKNLAGYDFTNPQTIVVS